MLCGRVPSGFKESYLVPIPIVLLYCIVLPIPKVKDTRTKALTCYDFRGTAISPVIMDARSA